jgi:hypothetical protein
MDHLNLYNAVGTRGAAVPVTGAPALQPLVLPQLLQQHTLEGNQAGIVTGFGRFLLNAGLHNSFNGFLAGLQADRPGFNLPQHLVDGTDSALLAAIGISGPPTPAAAPPPTFFAPSAPRALGQQGARAAQLSASFAGSGPAAAGELPLAGAPPGWPPDAVLKLTRWRDQPGLACAADVVHALIKGWRAGQGLDAAMSVFIYELQVNTAAEQQASKRRKLSPAAGGAGPAAGDAQPAAWDAQPAAGDAGPAAGGAGPAAGGAQPAAGGAGPAAKSGPVEYTEPCCKMMSALCLCSDVLFAKAKLDASVEQALTEANQPSGAGAEAAPVSSRSGSTSPFIACTPA